MKRMRRLVCMCIVMVICILNLNVSYAESRSNTDGIHVVYYEEGNAIVEKTTWDGLDGQVLRYVLPDGTGRVVYKRGGQIVSEKFISDADYTLYEEWLKKAPILKRDGIVDLPRTRGKEITGSQYKHVYIASTEKTYYKSDMDVWKTFADVYADISVDMVNIPSIVLSGFVKVIVNKTIDNTPEKLVVKTSAYEVWHTYDNSYYIHCYHMDCNSVNPTSSYKDYSQAIGGQ